MSGLRSTLWLLLALWHLVMAALVCAASAQEVRPFVTDVVRAPPSADPPGVRLRDGSPWSALQPQIASPPLLGGRVEVRRVEIRGDARRTEIVLTLASRTLVSAFALSGPDRVVIDGVGFEFAATSEILPRRRVLLGAPRMGPLDTATGRLLFDANGPVRVASVIGKPAGDVVEVTIAVVAAGRADPVSQAPILWGLPTVVVDTTTLPAVVARTTLPVVMIDPGHGGIDPGAVADQGVLEKDVVLAVALRLKSMLDARGRVQVLMTRQGDETVRLDQRVAVSRAQKTDLFISLHADTYAGQGGAQVRGGSIYVLGADGSNATARALAEKENMADVRAGIAGGETDHAVDVILADLTMRETQALSQGVQAALVQSLRRSILLAREPARAGAFRVLKQAETPAVLIELGYMSNSQDIALLTSAEWQMSIAARIADAVDTFFAKPRTIALDR